MPNKFGVFDLGEFKELKEIKRTEESYGRYLKTLANGQLETEVNYLLNEFSEDVYGKDYFSRGKLILKEISSRISSSLCRGKVSSSLDCLPSECNSSVAPNCDIQRIIFYGSLLATS